MITIKLIARFTALALTIFAFSLQSWAQTASDVKIEDAWIRTAVAGQSGTGGFMKLTAPANMKLIGVASPAAKIGEPRWLGHENG
jgi:periplasmic copper chaperone A